MNIEGEPSPDSVDALLSSVFVDGSEALAAYESVIPERDTKNFSLFNPLPEVFHQDVLSYAEMLCDGDYQKFLLRESVLQSDRANAAEILVEAMSEYERQSPNELAMEVIANGMTLFEQITGFDVGVVSESELANLLPRSPSPRKVDFLHYLLEIRKDFLDNQANRTMLMRYGVSSDGGNINITKIRLLRFGLDLASKKDAAISTVDPNLSVGFGFTTLQVIDSFRALTRYDLNNELKIDDPQF